MFKQLKPLLASCTALSIILSADGDNITVTVIPKPKATEDLAKGLATPLQLTGTAEELDAEFAQLLATYTASHTSLVEQVAAATAVMEEAKKTVAKTGTKAAAKPAPAKNVAPPQPGDGDSEDEIETVAPSPAAPAASGPVTADNLFSD